MTTIVVNLPNKSPYSVKDQAKASKATKFIGQGSPKSSTEAYRAAYAAVGLANCGTYSSEDVVFISAEGARSGRLDIDREEIFKAIKAGATLITDNITDRTRPYNVGERDLAFYLHTNRYREDPSGTWKPVKVGIHSSLSMLI